MNDESLEGSPPPSEEVREYDVLAPWGPLGAPSPGNWQPDVLGAPFECRTLKLLPDDEGEVVATVVRLPRADARFVFLYLHGRNDYFFQTELADTVTKAGGAFYALDLRKYGRSLRPWHTIGYVDNLDTYDEDLGEALGVIREDHPELPLILMGHSTGGLVATLWAYRHPGVCRGIALNSGWLDLQKLATIKPALKTVVARVAARNPMAVMVGSGTDHYSRSLMDGWQGSGFDVPADVAADSTDPALIGWTYYTEWKRPESYPVPAGWFAAIIAGHEEIEKHVHLDCPVLSLTSTAGYTDEAWAPEVFAADVVLDPDSIQERAAHLSDCVTLVRLPGKHDLALSDPPVRSAYYDALGRWLRAVLD